ncbi:hypothetical protein L486_03987 [Kwoniella mangroviensis CBS 10435]|uniref:IMD domain-containing protein n=1 Tax=Kwoniella mangroviensis CBS 10435 TaxID=1331196 RepID=A0A1B9IR07_9TREE|nr:uncharacterized protein I203_02925 [Kwoniella mangroviensis CBS 8507]OCF57961.1 hypothetical protein L486_03987 [Kwoniella mangroviensis CBS 10435]OCF68261.1 hypothetical protein I203_02925 [Kwoniella mangroviensis CBS 8507]OCF74937.1 hypothetical protein I204_03781 [Kwoniella mangroviensis CBS 8886]
MSTSARPRYDSMKSNGSSAWGVRPPSPTYSTTTTGSIVNLPENHALITRKDLRQSIACFEELMAAAKAYRNALLAMSSATAAFASAMEACSRVKGCRSSNSALAGASGLQYLVSNHEQILADAVYRQFEIPLLEALDHYKLVTADRLVAYEKALHEQSSKIRKTEAENGRRRKRDLQQLRQALAEMQRQVDELDGMKAAYHEEVLEGEDEIWDTVLNKVAFVVRSQLDFYEKIAGKASDPILEPLVMSIPDPFDSYGPPKEDGQIFSVLAPLGLLDSSAPQSPTPNLPRTGPSTPARSSSPTKPSALTASTTTPSKAEPTTEPVMGQLDGWLDADHNRERFGRARRELSIIEERDAASVIVRDDEVTSQVVVDDEEDTAVPGAGPTKEAQGKEVKENINFDGEQVNGYSVEEDVDELEDDDRVNTSTPDTGKTDIPPDTAKPDQDKT